MKRLWSDPKLVYVLLLATGLLALAPQKLEARTTRPPFTPTLLSVENLPRLRPIVQVGAFSSYDRSGGNDDGFSGKYSSLRKEGDGLVIAEVNGPGALTRLWTPTPIDAPIEFYFDGERTPRLVLPLRALFSGQTPPFIGPLVGHGLGGYWSYVPLEFARSIKVIVRAPLMRFYMVNYVRYAPQVPVRTFEPGDVFELPSIAEDGEKVHGKHVLAPGNAVTVFETSQPGRIQSLRLGPAQTFAGKDRAIVLRLYWEGAKRPAVEVPVGDFFGYSFGQPAMRSLLLGTEGEWNYVRFPMPFAQRARIELADERSSGEPLQVRSEIILSARGKTAEEGLFHAEWHRENPTRPGQPFTYVDVEGRGHLVGAILQVQGLEPGETVFLEGDDEATLDGKTTIHGTGSEDSFNGGFWGLPGRWYERASQPLSGCLDYSMPWSRAGGYRLFLGDAYSFRQHLRYTIEHGAEKNSVPADYTGTTFYYLNRPEGKATSIPQQADRAVVDPEHFRLAFFPSPPPIAALLNASLTPGGASLDGKWVTFVSLASNTSAWANPQLPAGLVPPETSDDFDGFLGPPVMALANDVPQAGEYTIVAEGLTGPRAAMLQLRVNDRPIGEVVDFYAPRPGRSGPRKLAELHLTQGTNLLYLTLTGRNPRSGGSSVELINLHGTRLK